MTLIAHRDTVVVGERFGGEPAVLVDGRWMWTPPVSELSTSELRALARSIAAQVSAGLSQTGPDRTGPDRTGAGPAGAGSSDDDKVRAATAVTARVTELNSARVAAGQGPLSPGCATGLIDAVMDRLFELGELTRWWRNPLVENIDVNGPSMAIVTFTGGVKLWVGGVAETGSELVDVVRHAARRLGLVEQGFDARNPNIDVQLPDGSRMYATFGGPGVSGVGVECYVSIRRHGFSRMSSGDLVAHGLMPAVAMGFLRACVVAGVNVIVAGNRNAGKTTLLRALAADIPAWHRVVTVESGLTELGLHVTHPGQPVRNVVALYARSANSEGEGAVTVAELIEGPTRRLNSTRVIAGEINNGNDLIPALECMTADTNGSMFTIHARDARTVVTRLQTYGLQATPPKSRELVRAMVADAAPVIVHITADESVDGSIRRFVTSIVEVTGVDRSGDTETVLMDDLWTLARPNPLEGHGSLEGRARPSVGLLTMLERHGWDWTRDGWSTP